MSAYLPALLWAAVLIALGSVPDMPGPSTDLPLDKVAHFVIYGVLGALLGNGWRRLRRPQPVLLLALALLIGAADEINQSRVHGRSAELADWIMDSLGITTAFWLRTRRLDAFSTKEPRE